MKRKRLCNIWVLALCSILFVPAYAEDSIAVEQPHKEKKQIYNSTQVKLDILSPILTPGLNEWQIQHYEMAVNVRLANRFYPTLEAGYATPGGFVRAGADICPFKKHPESPHALLIGLRIATGATALKADCWGELVVGCQVEVYKRFYMGWMGRLKLLFTRQTTDKDGNEYPTFIPGFGHRENLGWGVNYYVGFRI